MWRGPTDKLNDRFCGCGCGESIADLAPQARHLPTHRWRAYRRRKDPLIGSSKRKANQRAGLVERKTSSGRGYERRKTGIIQLNLQDDWWRHRNRLAKEWHTGSSETRTEPAPTRFVCKCGAIVAVAKVLQHNCAHVSPVHEPTKRPSVALQPWQPRRVSSSSLADATRRTQLSGEIVARKSRYGKTIPTPTEEAIAMLEALIEELIDARARTAGALMSLDSALAKARKIKALHPDDDEVQEAVESFLQHALSLAA